MAHDPTDVPLRADIDAGVRLTIRILASDPTVTWAEVNATGARIGQVARRALCIRASRLLGPGPIPCDPVALIGTREERQHRNLLSDAEVAAAIAPRAEVVDPRGIQPETTMAVQLSAGFGSFGGGFESFVPTRTFQTSLISGGLPGPGTSTTIPTVGGTLRDICRNLGFGSLCDLGEATIRSLIGGAQPGGSVPTVQCPEGFEFDPASNTCRVTGIRGTVERALPGGATGVMTLGTPVVGAFGHAALTPSVVGQITKRDGSTGPILRCPSRMVLGFDNLCYSKQLLPARSKNRKWRRPTKPPITASQWREIKGRKSTLDKVKEVATTAGFSCAKSGTRRGKR